MAHHGMASTNTRHGSTRSPRTDTGAFLIAEVPGTKNCIIGKNVDGLYMEDPLKNPDADLIRDITGPELIKLDLKDLVLEQMVVDLLSSAVNIHEVRIVTALSGDILRKPSTASGQNNLKSLFSSPVSMADHSDIYPINHN